MRSCRLPERRGVIRGQAQPVDRLSVRRCRRRLDPLPGLFLRQMAPAPASPASPIVRALPIGVGLSGETGRLGASPGVDGGGIAAL